MERYAARPEAVRTPLKFFLSKGGDVREIKRLSLEGATLQEVKGVVRRWVERDFSVRYKDNEGDLIEVEAEAEWEECVRLWLEENGQSGRALALYIEGGEGGKKKRAAAASTRAVRSKEKEKKKSRKVSIYFQNATNEPVIYLWIDPKGVEKPYGRLLPKQVSRQSTYSKHTWHVRNLRTNASHGTFTVCPLSSGCVVVAKQDCDVLDILPALPAKEPSEDTEKTETGAVSPLPASPKPAEAMTQQPFPDIPEETGYDSEECPPFVSGSVEELAQNESIFPPIKKCVVKEQQPLPELVPAASVAAEFVYGEPELPPKAATEVVVLQILELLFGSGFLKRKAELEFPKWVTIMESELDGMTVDVDITELKGYINTKGVQAICERRLDAAKQWLNFGLAIAPAEVIYHYNMACVHSLASNLDQAMAFLYSAKTLGFSGINELRADLDFDPIRSSPWFQHFLSLYDGSAASASPVAAPIPPLVPHPEDDETTPLLGSAVSSPPEADANDSLYLFSKGPEAPAPVAEAVAAVAAAVAATPAQAAEEPEVVAEAPVAESQPTAEPQEERTDASSPVPHAPVEDTAPQEERIEVLFPESVTRLLEMGIEIDANVAASLKASGGELLAVLNELLA